MKAIKCGDIFISDGIEFSFGCLHCSDIYDTFRDYQFHILEKHIQEIFGEGFNELLEVEIYDTTANISDSETEGSTETKEEKKENFNLVENKNTTFVNFQDINVKLEFENNVKLEFENKSPYEEYDKTYNEDDEDIKSVKDENISDDEVNQIDEEYEYMNEIEEIIFGKDECITEDKSEVENKNANYQNTNDESKKNFGNNTCEKKENVENNESSWNCFHCDKTFYDINMFKRHKKRTKCGKCPLCDNRNYADIWSHISKFHTEYYNERKKLGLAIYERPILSSLYCVYCDRLFKKENSYRDHMQMHEKSLDKCPYCGKHFREKGCLQTHIRTHTGERPFKCPHCPHAFSDNANLKTHIIIKHTAGLNAKCRYENCTKTFKTKELRNRHERYMHQESLDYLCLSCGMGFKTSSKLNIHVKTKHMDYEDRPHKCTYCDKRYIFKREFIHHIMTHTGEKPFKCEICPKGFKKKDSLNRHNKKHHSKQIENEMP